MAKAHDAAGRVVGQLGRSGRAPPKAGSARRRSSIRESRPLSDQRDLGSVANGVEPLGR